MMIQRSAFGGAVMATLAAIAILAGGCGAITLPGQSTSATLAPGSSITIGVGTAQDLEAMLPAQLCGETAVKQSFSGGVAGAASPDASTNPYAAVFAGLGTGAVAVAEPPDGSTCKVSAAAFRLTGANQLIIQAFLLAAASDSGGQSTQVNVGGKAVTKIDDGSGDITYFYVKGDTIFAIEAPSDDLAGPALSALP